MPGSAGARRLGEEFYGASFQRLTLELVPVPRETVLPPEFRERLSLLYNKRITQGTDLGLCIPLSKGVCR